MTDKEKIHQILSSLWKNDDSVGKMCYNQALQDVQTAIDLQEEPVSEDTMTIRKEWFEHCKESWYNEGYIDGKYNRDRQFKEPVSEELEEACEQLAENARKHKAETSSPFFSQTDYIQGVMDGAKWKVENLWKPADGDDLPYIGREVIVLIKYNAQRNIHDEEYPTYRVGFGHRPNPDGWDGKNIDTDEVTHYTPKLYDKGGWNAPNIAYWLDVELPKEIEL